MCHRWLKRALPVLLLFMLALPPLSTAQSQKGVPPSLYSIWVRLSLRGYNQAEIESLLRNMDAKAIADVKQRLRQIVLSNLELRKVRSRYLKSRDSDDLVTLRLSIETEIRFAGMETDTVLREMIIDRFGIPLDRL